ncbi:MAG TPA: ABC transporter substrate-binding protein [Jatrophihabitantaceae bacterium]
MSGSKIALAAAASALLLISAACGTRLPDSRFSARSGVGTPSAGGNTDVGVSGSQLTVGLMASLTGPLGGDTFSPPMYGAQAYFESLNARGGVNGRKIKMVTCDDQSSGSGNQECVHKLIDDDHVFALTATTSLNYAGASYVNGQGVPDIGGEPVTTAYDQYAHLYSIAGTYEPRNGTVGWNGKIINSTEVYRYLRLKLGARVAAVVHYNQADSARYARQIEHGLRVEGFTVDSEEVDFALPDFAATALDLKARHVDVVFDALDTAGNGALCQAIDQQGVHLTAKVTTVQGWNDQVRQDYAHAPGCRNAVYATAGERNYEDTSIPVVKQFRDDVARYAPKRRLSMWLLEGWTAAQWLTDAVASCGANVTRRCVEAFMNSDKPYTGNGMRVPVGFPRLATPPTKERECVNVARWQDSANGGKGGWVTQVPDMMTNCYEVPELLDSG